MSSFGKALKITTYGESHCKSVGVIIEGMPSNFHIEEHYIQKQLNRRRPGQNYLTTPRNEMDIVEIQSGTENGYTLGTPICAIVKNKDIKPQDYQFLSNIKIPRPSHADLSYLKKYKIHASSGGGRSSARETIGRVIAGAIADKWLKSKYNIEIVAWVSQVGNIKYEMKDNVFISNQLINRIIVDTYKTRCPDYIKSLEMEKLICKMKEEGNSVGGIISCVCRNVPAGIGEPCFDKLEAMLAHAMMSIPASKGFEIGSGFKSAQMKGTEHNDLFQWNENDGHLETTTNYSGGIQGGISNGSHITFNVAFKPPATIGIAQRTCDYNGTLQTLEAKGRHDPCVVNRAVPIVESMAALVLMDMIIQQFGK